MAAARRRCSKPPRAGPRCPGGPPSLPLPPLHRNRCGAPSFVAGVADSCRPGRSSWPPIRRRPASSIPADHGSGSRVSPRSILHPLPSRSGNTDSSDAMFRTIFHRGNRSLYYCIIGSGTNWFTACHCTYA
jgi:hypothetical protein